MGSRRRSRTGMSIRISNGNVVAVVDSQGAEAAVEVGEGGFHYLVVRGFARTRKYR